MVTKTISNRVNTSLRDGHLVIGPVLFPAVSFENVLRRLCAGLVLRRVILKYFPFGQMAAHVKTKRMKA